MSANIPANIHAVFILLRRQHLRPAPARLSVMPVVSAAQSRGFQVRLQPVRAAPAPAPTKAKAHAGPCRFSREQGETCWYLHGDSPAVAGDEDHKQGPWPLAPSGSDPASEAAQTRGTKCTRGARLAELKT